MAESSTLINDFVAEQQESENEILYNVSSNQQKPMEETLEMPEEDRISALPDSLLLHILSLLSSCDSYVQDSIKTSTLSKRWQYLWASVPILIFQEGLSYSIFEERKSSKHEFVSSVNRTLILRGHNKLKKFDVSTYNYSEAYQPHFNVWIRYAVVCNVEELLIATFSEEDYDIYYELPLHLFRNPCLTKLCLDYCILEPIGEINWKNLKSLSIGHECITQKLINNILSGSPSLECLELYYCRGSGFDVLNFTSISLKKLIVSGYHGKKEGVWAALKIQAHNILSLEIIDFMLAMEVILLDVPSLVEAYLNYWWQPISKSEVVASDEIEEEMLKYFIKNLQHVNELKCGPLCLPILSRLKAKGFTCPPNMKFHVTS